MRQQEDKGVAADAAHAASPSDLSPASGSSRSGIANALVSDLVFVVATAVGLIAALVGSVAILLAWPFQLMRCLSAMRKAHFGATGGSDR